MASDELGILALVQALSTDEGTKARALELLDQMQQIEAGKKQIEQTRAEAEAMMTHAGEDRAAAERALRMAQDKEAQAATERDGLANAIQSHQDEAVRFAEMRAKIEAEHATREAAVADREARMDAAEKDIADRHAALAKREKAVAAAEALHAERQHAAEALINAAKPWLLPSEPA